MDFNNIDWKEATYGTWMTRINNDIIYWNRYDNYFKISNEKKKLNKEDFEERYKK